MTLKNLSTITEKTILISSSGIVSRLRCVICILISFICTLSGLNNLFAQDLQVKYIGKNTYDPADAPVSTMLVYDYIPLVNAAPSQVANIEIKRVDYGFYIDDYTPAFGGFRKQITINGVRGWRQCYFADAENIYSFYYTLGNENEIIDKFFTSEALAPFNLGTVKQRRDSLFSMNIFTVSPVDFRSYIQPWILIGISIFLAIPLLWWVIKRFLK